MSFRDNIYIYIYIFELTRKEGVSHKTILSLLVKSIYIGPIHIVRRGFLNYKHLDGRVLRSSWV